jgi:hypothetical protein
MVKKLFSLLLGLVLVACLSTVALAQADTAANDSKKDDKKEAKATAEKKARWEGIVVRSNKDKSTLTVRKRGTAQERTVEYDSSTEFAAQEHGSKKTTKIDPSEIKDGDRIIAVGTWDKKGVLHASLISKRLTKS